MTTSDEVVEHLENIDNRLKWLLTLRIEEHFDDESTNEERVELLHKIGFSNDEMADMVGTSSDSIRATLSNLRAKGVIEDDGG